MSPLKEISQATEEQIEFAHKRSKPKPPNTSQYKTELAKVADKVVEQLNTGTPGVAIEFEGPDADFESFVASENLRMDLKTRGIQKAIVVRDNRSFKEHKISTVIITPRQTEKD